MTSAQVESLGVTGLPEWVQRVVQRAHEEIVMANASDSYQYQMHGYADVIVALSSKLARSASAIRVWAWKDAPAEFRALSTHGGDEDWVAYIPAALADEWIGWMEPGTAFGCCDVSEHPWHDGALIRIGAHA